MQTSFKKAKLNDQITENQLKVILLEDKIEQLKRESRYNILIGDTFASIISIQLEKNMISNASDGKTILTNSLREVWELEFDLKTAARSVFLLIKQNKNIFEWFLTDNGSNTKKIFKKQKVKD